ncbi:MAG TPA: hypothetical protein [Caudoviricetes sp.]|nr:MAG TPA: hypothetical protein [Caudoviricetes sp.]
MHSISVPNSSQLLGHFLSRLSCCLSRLDRNIRTTNYFIVRDTLLIENLSSFSIILSRNS